MLVHIKSPLTAAFMTLSGALLAPTSFSSPAFAQVSTLVSPEDAAKLIEQNRNNPKFVILDVRTSDEFNEGHIAGAKRIDFYDENFRDQIAKLDKSNHYLLYCRSGARSGKTAELMASLGFNHVHDIKGGITAWRAAKLPLASAK